MLAPSPVEAAGGRRGESQKKAAQLEITLPQSTQFGDVLLPAGKFIVTLSKDRLAFARPKTMVVVASVPALLSPLKQSVTPAKVHLLHKGDQITVVLQHLDKAYTVLGTTTHSPTRAQPTLVQLAGKSETVMEGGIPESHSERALVESALPRYDREVKHCIDQAHRSRWQTDDPKFVRCVCPNTEKWRLPKVSTPMRVHRALAKGKSGFSITVTSAGKATECRVWVGPKSPEQLTDPAKPGAKEHSNDGG